MAVFAGFVLNLNLLPAVGSRISRDAGFLVPLLLAVPTFLLLVVLQIVVLTKFKNLQCLLFRALLQVVVILSPLNFRLKGAPRGDSRVGPRGILL